MKRCLVFLIAALAPLLAQGQSQAGGLPALREEVQLETNARKAADVAEANARIAADEREAAARQGADADLLTQMNLQKVTTRPATSTECGSLGGTALVSATGTQFACNGAPGAKGDKGDQGLQGPKGDQGDPGPAAAAVEPGLPAIPTQTMAFLRIDNVQGNSTDPRHKDWIDIEGYSFGTGNTGSSPVGGGGGAGKGTAAELVVQFANNISIPKLFEYVAKGTHSKQATLEVWTSGTDDWRRLLTVEFFEVQVSYLSIGPDRSICALRFLKVEFTYYVLNPNGSTSSINETLDLHALGIIAGTGPRLSPSTHPGAGEAVFAKIETLEGGATARGHEKWILGRGVGLTIANSTVIIGGGGGAGKPEFSTLQVEKDIDKATVPLLVDAARGTHYKSATIDVCSNTTQFCPLSFDIDTDIVVNVSNLSGPETVNLGYARLTITYRADATHEMHFGWDLAQNQEF